MRWVYLFFYFYFEYAVTEAGRNEVFGVGEFGAGLEF